MTKTETTTYWEPNGWSENRTAPAPFVAFCKAHDAASGPAERLAINLTDYGYNAVYFWKAFNFEEDAPRIEITLQKHDDGHMLVEVDREGSYWHQGAVEAGWVGAFMMSGLPQLIQLCSQPTIAQHLEMIDRTIRAFVRHGQGEKTINAGGYQTLDERRAEIESQRFQKHHPTSA